MNNKININKIYCIAIPKRKAYMENTLYKYFQFPKSKVTFIKPILKDKLDRNDLITNKIITKKCKLNMGEIACYLSHIKTLKQFLASNNKYCLIFEDDIEAKNRKTTIKKMNTILNNVPKNFNILYLGRCYDLCHYDQNINPYLYKTKHTLCTHAYIISRTGAKIILNKSLPINIPIDTHYAQLIYSNKLVSYASKKNIFNQSNNIKSNLRKYSWKNKPECKLYSNLLREFKFLFSRT